MWRYRTSTTEPGRAGPVSGNPVYRPEPTTSHQRGHSVEWICGPTPPWRRKRRSSFETEFCNGQGSKTEARDNPILLCVETEIRGAENPDSRSSGDRPPPAPYSFRGGLLWSFRELE